MGNMFDTQAHAFMNDSIEFQSTKKASMNEMNLGVLASAVKHSVSLKNEPFSPVVGSQPISGVKPCTDCNGENPCTDCAGGTQLPFNQGMNQGITFGEMDPNNPTAPVTKDAWIDINIPNQGDPTVEQQKELEAEKRKRILLIGVLLLALLLIALFAVKMFKKS